jgi:hypothetical protein
MSLDIELKKTISEKDECGNTIIHRLCGNNRDYTILKAIEKYIDKENINIKNNDGQTPLHIFINNYDNTCDDDKKILDFLLDKNSDVHSVNNKNISISEIAIIRYSDEYCLRKLHKAGADFNDGEPVMAYKKHPNFVNFCKNQNKIENENLKRENIILKEKLNNLEHLHKKSEETIKKLQEIIT